MHNATQPVEYDTSTLVSKEKLLFFRSSWEPTFLVPNQFHLGGNALSGSKLGGRAGSMLVEKACMRGST